MNNKFTFFSEAFLEKSVDAPSLTNPVRVGGIITTEDRDIDNEIISKSSDFSYFEGGFGKIKFEHKDYKEPHSIIGFPTKLIRKGGQVSFEGELIPFDPTLSKQPTLQKELAKATYDLLLEMEEHNKRHPGMPQKGGWSIEGEYLSKSKQTGLVKARVVNVVFTTKPRNMSTYAEILHKSLEVGYGMSPETQTGFGALRKESLQGTKNHATKNNKGENKMFKTKEEVYKEAISNGKSVEEARKAALDFESDKNKTVTDSFTSAEKSLGTSKELLEKSIKTAQDVNTFEVELDLESYKKGLSKSIQFEEGEENTFEVIPFFKAQSKILSKSLEAIEAITKKVDTLAKSVELMGEARVNEIESASFSQNGIALIRQELQTMEKSLQLFARGIQKSVGNTLTSDLASIKVDDNDAEPKGSKQLNKSQTLDILEGLVKEEKVDSRAVTRYESSGYLDAREAELVQEAANKQK